MRRTLVVIFCLISAFCSISCNKESGMEPKMKIAISDISSTGCTVGVMLSDGASGYRMKVVSLEEFDADALTEELSQGVSYTAEKRLIERLSGCKDFVIAARPFAPDGSLGALVSENFTLGEFSLKLTLYTPGDSLGVTLNRYNTLKVMATSNGIAARGRCALALSEVWLPLYELKGLTAAAEEVFSSNCIQFTQQQLEELSDPNKMKRDLMYFNDLSDGTEYTLVVCLEDLDGESHYYSFNGATKRLNP